MSNCYTMSTRYSKQLLQYFAQFAEMLEGKQACVVAIAEGDAIGIVAGQDHAVNLGGRQFVRREDREFCRLGFGDFAFVAAHHTGAGLAEFGTGVPPALAVAPADQQRLIIESFDFGGGQFH